ncbi:hypothetical protein HID58_094283 [Brassica napus]|uniref:FRIGIDA-like protein n=1 Tax=Brassica napus TaxID=3708 RepID=A0ABQ7X863_BRANA|nr:hypothetical protein HID58_094283 [Brassica napus]
MYGGDLFSGYSPGRPSFSQAPSFHSRQTKQGTADTRGDVPRTDELAGNAATGEKSAPCGTAAGDPESGRPTALSEGTDTTAMPLASPGVDVFVAGSQPSSCIPAIDEASGVDSASAEGATTFSQPPGPSSSVISEVCLPHLSQPQVPSDVSHTNTEPAPGSTVDAIPTELPVLPSSIHQTVGVPSAASIVETVATQLLVLPSTLHQESPPQTDISGTTLPILPTAETPSAVAMSGSCPGTFYTASNVLAHVDTPNLSQQLLPPSSSQAITLQPTSSPTIEPMLHDVEDDVGGSVATEEDEVLTKKTPSKPRKAGRAVKLKTVGPPDGFKRYRKRERRSPDRYTPAEGPEKQEPVKRVRRGPKEKEKVVPSVAEPSITIKETTSFIGGFTPFLPPNPVKRAAFLQVMKDAKTQSAAKDCAFQVDTLMPLFDSSRVASEKAIDCVVAFIRKRRDGLPPSRLEMPYVVEHPGCSAVVALMLLEMHAVGKDVNAVKFTEEQARTAGENYAVEALHLCQAVPIPSAQ